MKDSLILGIFALDLDAFLSLAGVEALVWKDWAI